MRHGPEEVRLLRGLALRGMRQRAVAKALGVSETLVSLWANGRRGATDHHLAALRALYEQTQSNEERRSNKRVSQLANILRAADAGRDR